MKTILKISVLCLLLFFSMNAKAQRNYDTIMERYPYYYYQWWGDTLLQDSTRFLTYGWSCHDYYGMIHHSDHIFFDSLESDFFQNDGYQFQRNIINGGMNIYGIAVSGSVRSILDIYNTLDGASWMPEYLILAEAERDSFYFMDSVIWLQNAPTRYMKIDQRGWWESLECYCTSLDGEYYDSATYVPIWECYFDKPIYVTDSFYVGTTYNSHRWTLDDVHETGVGHAPNWSEIGIVYSPFPSIDPSGICDSIPNQKFRFYVDSGSIYSDNYPHNHMREWRYTDKHYLMLLFPIIAPDSVNPPEPYHCPSVEGFSVLDQSDDCVVLSWQSDPLQLRWQVSLCPVGTDPDSGTIYDCLTTVKNLCGMTPGQHYKVYVRALCEYYYEQYYSDWSDGIEVWMGMDTTSISSAPAPVLAVTPNPVSRTLMVSTDSEGPHSVEVFDMAGTLVLSQTLAGLKSALDVEQLPAGQYILRLRNARGTAVKKLVVR